VTFRSDRHKIEFPLRKSESADAISILGRNHSSEFPVYWDTLLLACLTIASFLLWVGMKRLAQMDPKNFIRPKQLTLASPVGFPIIGLGFGLVF